MEFIQYEFYTQWGKLKAYANSNGIEIIGDIPIYMGYDSVDVWANQAEFQLDENLTPVKVAGVPPDAFQIWVRSGAIHYMTGLRWRTVILDGGE